MQPTIPPLGAVESRDVAEHAEAVDHGPSPIHRAVLGLAVGLCAGVIAAALTPGPSRRRG